MNKFCHTGFSQIQELYNQHVEQIDSALQHCKETPCTNGMAENPFLISYEMTLRLPELYFFAFSWPYTP